MKIITKILIFFIWVFSALAGNALAKDQRIISLAPATTEILFALGLDKEIIGVSTFCDYPKAALAKEKVGTFSQPDIEKIISLKPDIIFATGLEQVPAVDGLRRLKLNICVSDPANLEQLYSSIEDIGRLTNRKQEALELVARMRSDVEKVALRAASFSKLPKPKVFVEIGHDPLMTAGKGSFVDELIAIAGGINIAAGINKPYPYYNFEEIIKQDPDCIILGYMVHGDNKDDLVKRLGWSNIKAVKNNRVYSDIDPDLFLRPGPRLIEGLKEINKRLYPDEK